jgi:methanogenic corrinoid protein MtbC1
MIHVYEELGDSSRRRLLFELRAGPKTVGDLVLATFMKQPNVSSHLARMRVKGIVRAEKVGRQVFYSFASSDIEEIVSRALANRETMCPALCRQEAARKYAAAAIDGDETMCAAIIDHALKAQLSLVDIYQDIIASAMVSIGHSHRNEQSHNAAEHIASAITERMMARVVAKFVPACKQDRMALLGCGPNAGHAIGLRMVADYLTLCGWRTLFLGANIPHRCFVNVFDNSQPELVLLSCVSEEGLESGLHLIRELSSRRNGRRKFVIGVGGPCVCKNKQEFLDAGADFTCSNLRVFSTEFLPAIERTGKVPSPF